ncbi:hypothetical protein QTP88_019725 [Uroleucon formosanum]
MKEHCMKKHPDKSNKNILYFTDLKNKFEKRKTVTGLFNKTHLNNDKGLLASYKVSLLVAKCGKPHTIGETLILPAVEAILKSMTNLNVTNIISSIPLKKGIPITNYIACATDGAPAMIGRQRGFIAHLKNAVPGILTVHCVIHRQHLVSKNLSDELFDTMRFVINAVNKIKAKSLNDRLFRQLCRENDEDFERFVLHTEVRWLSKGNCLTRFYNLFQTILEFLQPLDKQLYDELHKRETNIAYLADIFEKLNDVNKNLQGDKINFIKSNSKQILDSDLEIYCAHLESLKDDMSTRFKDINDLIIAEWVLNPFLADIQNLQPSIQEELLEVKHNEEAKIDFKHNGYELFWLKQKSMYPQLWKEVELLIMAFPSTYLVEKSFSAVQQLLTKSRNKLEICERGDLRLMLTSIEPDIISLAGNHQPQGSH